MPSENVAVVQQLMAAWDAEDTDAQIAHLDSEVELVEWPEAVGSKTWHGHEGARAALEAWADVWETQTTEVTEIVETDDRVLMCARNHVRGKGSELEMTHDSFTVYRLRDGKITRIEFFIEKEPALRAAGLSEEAE